MQIAETFGDEGFDIPRRYFAAVAISALSFFASMARVYRQRS